MNQGHFPTETCLAGSSKILCGRKSSFRALPSFEWKALPKQSVSIKCLFSIDLHFSGKKCTTRRLLGSSALAIRYVITETETEKLF